MAAFLRGRAGRSIPVRQKMCGEKTTVACLLRGPAARSMRTGTRDRSGARALAGRRVQPETTGSPDFSSPLPVPLPSSTFPPHP